MKRISLLLAFALVLMLVGASAAYAAPGDYPDSDPDYTNPSNIYWDTLSETSGKTNGDPLKGWTGVDNATDPNANHTGMDQYGIDVASGDDNYATTIIKNVYGQRTHGEYANDTNSCASCHQTHTAAGQHLLFKDGIFNTCVACHDGTLGFYNVMATGAAASNAGTFGGNPDKAIGNASVHLATGDLKVAAAPGGNRTSDDPDSWGKVFTCASCHAPHGSYSDRLLHYNANNVGGRTPAEGGNKIVGAIAKKGTDNIYRAYNVMDAVYGGPWTDSIDMDHRYHLTQIKVNGQHFLKDVAGVVYDTPYQTWNDVLQVNLNKGIFTDDNTKIPAGATVSVDIAPALVVKLNTAQITDDAGANALGIKIYKVVGYQSGMNEYCGACHFDYDTNLPDSYITGLFSSAFRHNMTGVDTVKGLLGEGALHNNEVNQDIQQMVCLTCHYAHGTDKSVMQVANDQYLRDITDSEPDKNYSSALKRYTNMAVCWKCHTSSKSEQLINNDSYFTKVGTINGPGPVNGQSEVVPQ